MIQRNKNYKANDNTVLSWDSRVKVYEVFHVWQDSWAWTTDLNAVNQSARDMIIATSVRL